MVTMITKVGWFSLEIVFHNLGTMNSNLTHRIQLPVQ